MKSPIARPRIPTPEQAAIANLLLVAVALLGTFHTDGPLFAPAAFALAAGTVAAPPLAIACWIRSNRDPANAIRTRCATAAVFSVYITVALWAIAASERYGTPWPALAAVTILTLVLIP